MRTERELRALVELLGDDQERVAAVVREALLDAGDLALPYLEEATESPQPLLRGRARLLLTQLRRGALEATWRSFAQLPDADLDLERGCMLLAGLAEGTEVPAVSSFLDAIGGMVRSAMAATGSGIQALGEVLFENLGFRGGEFEDPACHFLPTVLERRMGIPISLTAVYILVGRRAGLPVSGVNMPSHFLARFERPEGPVFIDCFNRGHIYDQFTLEEFVVRRARRTSTDLLEPASTRTILLRMLNNLEAVYAGTGNPQMTENVQRWRSILTLEA